MLDIVPSAPCTIHNVSPTHAPIESFQHDKNGMLLVCVCEEDCHSCRYTKLSELIKHGIKFKAFYTDSNQKLQEIPVVEDTPSLDSTIPEILAKKKAYDQRTNYDGDM